MKNIVIRWKTLYLIKGNKKDYFEIDKNMKPEYSVYGKHNSNR